MHINPQNHLTTGFWTDVANSAFKLLKALKQQPSNTTPPYGLIAIWRFLSGRSGQVKVTL